MNLLFRYFFAVWIIILFNSCNIIPTKTERVNPSPIPSVSQKPSIPVFSPFPELQPMETPSPSSLDLANYTFQIDIDFDAILGRIIFDDGDIKTFPAKYIVKGGDHKIFVFDLLTKCSFTKSYTVDKNMTLIFKKEKECVN